MIAGGRLEREVGEVLLWRDQDGCGHACGAIVSFVAAGVDSREDREVGDEVRVMLGYVMWWTLSAVVGLL